MLQSQVDKLKQDLSSSKDKTQELEKLVSELKPFKEQVQVSTNPLKYGHISWINMFQCIKHCIDILPFQALNQNVTQAL